jgi:hypothetical protein
MESTEIQARATIAAALIVSRAVEVPSIPASGDWSMDRAALRLRDLTDYVYEMITRPAPREAQVRNPSVAATRDREGMQS